MIIGEYSPRRSQGEYSPKITEPEANNCFSIFTHSSEYKKQFSISLYAKVIFLREIIGAPKMLFTL